MQQGFALTGFCFDNIIKRDTLNKQIITCFCLYTLDAMIINDAVFMLCSIDFEVISV
jgi:hypothetical protein